MGRKTQPEIAINNKSNASFRDGPIPLKEISKWAVPVFFLVFFFLYLLLYIDPAVIYSCNGFDLHEYVRELHVNEVAGLNFDPIQQFNREHFILELTPSYFGEILKFPGGMTRLLATLTIYSCHHAIPGAMVLTFIAFLLLFLFASYTGRRDVAFESKIRADRMGILHYLPPLFLLVLCGWYELNSLMVFLPVIGALGACVVYQRLNASGILRSVFFLFAVVLTYWLFQWGCILFLLLACMHDFFINRKKAVIVVVVSIAAVALLTAFERYVLPVDKAFDLRTFYSSIGRPVFTVLYFPLAAALYSPFAVRIVKRLSVTPSGLFVNRIFSAALIALVAAASVTWPMKDNVCRDLRTVARTLHNELNGRWNEIIHENTSGLFRNFPVRDGRLQLFMTSVTDHALCNTGRLGSEMFAFPQNRTLPEPLLLFTNSLTYGFAKWAVALDIYMDLGMVNFAEKTAGEIMENMGPYPFVIYRRALIQLAKGNNEAASVYLNKLKTMPYYRKEALQLLGELNDSALLYADPQIGSMKRHMDTSDYFIYQADEEKALLNLLKSDPGNKIAFEYLMAFYLQTGHPERMAEKIRDGVKYNLIPSPLPRHWQEGLCIYIALDSALASHPPQLGISEKVFNDFDRFNRMYSQYESADAAGKLEKEFGSSYFYFYSFAFTPGGKR